MSFGMERLKKCKKKINNKKWLKFQKKRLRQRKVRVGSLLSMLKSKFIQASRIVDMALKGFLMDQSVKVPSTLSTVPTITQVQQNTSISTTMISNLKTETCYTTTFLCFNLNHIILRLSQRISGQQVTTSCHKHIPSRD